VALAGSASLLPGQIYLLTDEARIAIALTASTFETYAKQSEAGGAADPLDLTVQNPAAPAAGVVRLSRFERAARQFLAFRGNRGENSALQPHSFFNRLGLWVPAAGVNTIPAMIGFPALTAVGTATARTPANTNRFTRGARLGYVSAATAGSLVTLRNAAVSITVGSGSEDGNGFFMAYRFGISDAAAVAGARMFVGTRQTGAAGTGVEPSTLVGCIGVGHGAADTTMHLYYGGSVAQTPIDLGENFPANTRSTDIYTLLLFAPYDEANTVYWEVNRNNTGDTASGVIAGDATVLPQSGAFLAPMNSYRTNNATALAVGIDMFRMYLETMD